MNSVRKRGDRSLRVQKAKKALGRKPDAQPGTAGDHSIHQPFVNKTADSAPRSLGSGGQTGFASKNEDYLRATFLLATAAHRWRKLANDRLTMIGQTMAQCEALLLVASADEGLSQGELAHKTGIAGPTVARMFSSLAKEGAIKRTHSAGDARITVNRITAKGISDIIEVMKITDDLREKVLGDVDPQQLAACLEVLRAIIRNIRYIDR